MASRFCLICNTEIPLSTAQKEFCQVGEKGLLTINSYSEKYNSLNPDVPFVIHKFNTDSKLFVHIQCRKDYTDERKLVKNAKMNINF